MEANSKRMTKFLMVGKQIILKELDKEKQMVKIY